MNDKNREGEMMNLFMTSGTIDFLSRLKERHPEKQLVLMASDFSALLLHETKGKTIFNEPRCYEVIDSVGEIGENGFVVMNHIPITDEGRPLFEYRFKNRQRLVERQTGFVAIRVLRPIQGNTFVILTVWEDEYDFNRWRQSNDYQHAHPRNNKYQRDIFAGSPYTMKYVIATEDEEEK